MESVGLGRGSNSAQLRRYNERLVLQRLRRAGEASKADLARAADLTNTAVGAIIQKLEGLGLIEAVGKRHDGGRGQPATMLRLNPKGAYGIGVRLDRRLTETILIDFDGHAMARRAYDIVLPRPDKALDMVERDIRDLLALLDRSERDRFAGIGLAQPYNLGAWLGRLDLPTDTFSLWEDFDFAARLEERIGLPVFAENDGNAAAIAELFYGVGRRADDFFYLFIGPAIGGGIVVDGDCLRGSLGNAGDVAVIPVAPSRLASAPQSADGRELLITRASLNALGRHLQHNGVPTASASEMEAAFAKGHPAVCEWLDDAVDALAPALWTAFALLDVPLLVVDADIDGGLVDALIGRLGAALAEQAPEARRPPRILHGSFGRDAGAIGAASLPMFFSFSPRASILTRGGDERDMIAATAPGGARAGE
ncbi:ROK family transcriptional regulator [Kaistia dalseonensis]|uniref:NBD/HSP70 family sugar kinase n=1 Tax=Kaistia dalseonensis TaxID=410840 RepID=A0ABU0HCZ5_9HYPH|nr:ROK family transcriptional regulator [Kaistia dalseonensis]MCX5497553.1 ROK family transcriptional regulator [Kaistia dalseonensis]MDQ0440193.1 putative NBD/HSP70 family sugar kinase [Kaistia dalseonensis]